MKKGKIIIAIILISVTLFSILGLKGNRTKNLKTFIGQAEEMTTTDGDYEYEILEDGTVEITKYKGTKTTVAIPKTINGKTVTSIGEGAFYFCSSLTSIEIPSGVTSIGDNAFECCSSLTSIEIPEGVTSIGFDVFSGCSSLTSINVDTNNKKYSSENGVLFNKEKTSLICYPAGKQGTTYTIPSTVTSIERYAFYECSSLRSIEIPSSVTSIGYRAFERCSSLMSIEIPSSVESIGSYAFYICSSLRSIEIPSSVTSIGSNAFYYCSSLTSINVDKNNKQYNSENGVLFNKDKTSLICYPEGKQGTTYTIPSSVESIGSSAFYYCSSLKSINIPSSVTSIGEDAFFGCSSLTSINIPSRVTSIGRHAFTECSSLTSIEIPEGVKSIGEDTFARCSSLTSINIPSSVTSIGNGAFSGCSSLTSIEIPSRVTSIGRSAFSGCSSLTSIEIPSSVTSIGDWAFSRCSSLTSIEIPSRVTSIGEHEFYDCSSLKSINIPSSVTSIGDNAFGYCSSLEQITIPGSVKEIEDEAFYYCSSKLTIYCEMNSKAEAYAKENKINYETKKEWDLSRDDGISNVTAKIDENGTLIIKGNGYMKNYEKLTENAENWNPSPFGTAKSSIKKVSITGDIKNIGMYLFYYATNLQEVTIEKPELIEYIGGGAFFGCKKLTSITPLNNITAIGARAFCHCHSLTTINLSNAKNLERIGHEAFRDCYLLENVKLPEGLKVIGYESFLNCISLKNLIIPSTVVAMGTKGDSKTETGLGTKDMLTDEEKTAGNTTGYNNVFTINSPESGTEYESYIKTVLEQNSMQTIEDLLTETKVWYYSNCSVMNEYAEQKATTEMVITKLEWDISENQDESIIATLDPAGKLTIEGTGKIYNYERAKTPWNAIRTYIKEVEISEGITSIGEFLFYYNNNLGSVKLPSTLEKIEYGAFFGCKALTSITPLNNITAIGARAFCHCHSLTAIDLSNAKNLERIGHEAFKDCYLLKNVQLPEGLKVIGYESFLNCISLKNLIIPSTVQAIGTKGDLETETGLGTKDMLTDEEKEAGNTTGYNNVFTIDFSRNTNTEEYKGYIKTVLEQNSMQTIEDLLTETKVWYYSNCSVMNKYAKQKATTEMVITKLEWDISENQDESIIATLDPAGKLTIEGTGKIHNYDNKNARTPWNAIRTYIKEVEISEGITNIGAYLFYYNNNLESVKLPKTLEKIECGAFFGCKALTSITPLNNIKAIEARAFCHCHSLTAMNLSNAKNLERIGHEAFRDCYLLENVKLPEGLKVIGYESFLNCISLKDLTIPSTVQAIGTKGDLETETGLGTKDMLTDEEKEAGNTTGYNHVFAINSPESGTEYESYIKSIFGEWDKIERETLGKVKYYNGSEVMATYAKDNSEERTFIQIEKCEHKWDDGKCTVCGYICKHNVENWEDVQDLHRGKCTICENYVFEDHTYTAQITEPTHTSGGYTTYTCTKCGYSYTGNETDPRHTWNEGTVTKEATCKAEGVKTFTCTACGATKTEAIPKTEHTWNSGQITKEATCTTEGVKTYTCTGCNETRTEKIPATGHTEVIDAGKAATCTETGLTEGKHCKVCGTITVKQQEIAAKGHTIVTDAGKVATCTEKGLTEGKHCKVCGIITVKQQEIPAKGHNYQTRVIAPTCTEKGYTKHTCTRCKDTYNDTETDALGHSFTNYVSNNDATCTEDGHKTAKCERCDETNTITDVGSMIEHNYKNGECTMCGKKEDKINIDTGKYEKLNAYITNIQPETTLSKFKENIDTNATKIEVYDSQTVLSDNKYVATGMKVAFTLNSEKVEFTLVVRGDVNGDGLADFKDMSAMNSHRLGKKEIQGAYYLAGNVEINGDSKDKIDFKDMSKLNSFRLHKISEV